MRLTCLWIRTAAISTSGPAAGGDIRADIPIRASDGAKHNPPRTHSYIQPQSDPQHLKEKVSMFVFIFIKLNGILFFFFFFKVCRSAFFSPTVQSLFSH